MKNQLLIFTIIAIIFAFGINKPVQASDKFHEAEYIPNIWVNKEKNGKIRYQQARFLRRSNDNQFSYCIEPWEIINSEVQYPEKIDINTLDDYTLNQMALVAYYGYGYKNHNDSKWYYITQLIIWRLADPSAHFYFTNKLNGKEISAYDTAIQEINNLVNKHALKPSFDNQKYKILYGEKLYLDDTNKALSKYNISTDFFSYSQSGNNITIQGGEVGKGEIIFTKRDYTYSTPPIVYRSNTNQDFLTVGSFRDIISKISVEVVGGSIEIEKIDATTKSKISSSTEASLLGSTFEIYNNHNTLITTVSIGDNNNPIITGLPTGTYKIKEIKAGIGYKLNKSENYITISSTNTTPKITIENEVIEKNVILEKYFGKENRWIPEPNITFSIYNKEKILVKEITTNKEGQVLFSLPYGTYTVIQKNTLPNYKKIDNFNITISDKEDVLRFKKYNEEITGNIIINKIDYATNLPITNSPANFKIFNLDTMKWLDDIYTTDNYGVLKINSLSFGAYKIVEIKAPSDYLLLNEEYTFTIDSNNLLVNIEIKNERIIHIPDTSTSIEIIEKAEYYFDKKKMDYINYCYCIN